MLAARAQSRRQAGQAATAGTIEPPRRQALRSRLVAPGLALLAACAGGGGEATCRVSVVGVEKWQIRSRGLDAAYRVQGDAGAPAVVSLVAKLGSERYITGQGVRVGPGPFVAIVDLELTGEPPELLVLLEVGPRRCTARAQKPS